MFSMNQILTGILSSDSATSVRKVRRHSSAEAIGGVRLRYVGALPGPAATRIHTKLAYLVGASDRLSKVLSLSFSLGLSTDTVKLEIALAIGPNYLRVNYSSNSWTVRQQTPKNVSRVLDPPWLLGRWVFVENLLPV